MAYQKKNLTPEERSAIYRANAMKVKNRRGGRKPRLNAEGFVAPSKTMKIREDDHAAIVEVSRELGSSFSHALHVVLFRYGLADNSMRRKGQAWPEEPR